MFVYDCSVVTPVPSSYRSLSINPIVAACATTLDHQKQANKWQQAKEILKESQT